MNWQVVPTERRHIAGFRDVLDSVARERRYLAFLEAPSAAQMRRFVLNNLRNRAPQFVAVEDDRVLGWCDIVPKTHATLRHVGALGMGIAAPHRSRGSARRCCRRRSNERRRAGSAGSSCWSGPTTSTPLRSTGASASSSRVGCGIT